MATPAAHYHYALGRRKSSTARVRLSGGKGTIIINDQPAESYFAGSKYLLKKLLEPFGALEQENKFAITIRVAGGGHNGQAEAIRLGIAKALVVMNEKDFKPTLRRAELLGRDAREKERKKFGLKGARKQRQFTKR
ncbi:MAG: 30S ribosomal protein S9 [Candidatus Saccharimonadales bacterium]